MNKRIIFICLTILGLVMLESPIILLANRIEPMVLGIPFLVFWILIWWLFCTVVFFIAYKANWGNNKKESE